MQNTINLKNQKEQPSGHVSRPAPVMPKLEPKPEVLKTSEIRAKNIPDKISWSGPMSSHEPDKRFVIVVSGVLVLSAVLSQIFQGNIITTIFLALLGVMIFVQSRKEPEEGSFEVSPVGIKINDTVHHIREVKSFWIEYQPEGIKELSLRLNKWHAPYLKIPIGDTNPLQIRSMLVLFIPEEEHEDTIVEIVQRKLGL